MDEEDEGEEHEAGNDGNGDTAGASCDSTGDTGETVELEEEGLARSSIAPLIINKARHWVNGTTEVEVEAVESSPSGKKSVLGKGGNRRNAELEGEGREDCSLASASA